MRASRLAPAALALAFLPGSAHDVITTKVTFAREISRLLYARCVSCHRPGGSAFSLATYEEARPWAKAIKEESLERRMPPWGAVKGFGEFRDDQGLTQEQIELISDWVEGGAPEGDAKYLPKLPDPAPRRSTASPAGMEAADGLVLKSTLRLAGVHVKQPPRSGSVQAVAIRPDGTTEPLLWLYAYDPRFPHPFWYSTPIALPPGTRIEISPADAGPITLLKR